MHATAPRPPSAERRVAVAITRTAARAAEHGGVIGITRTAAQRRGAFSAKHRVELALHTIDVAVLRERQLGHDQVARLLE